MTNKELFKEAYNIDVDINMCPYGIPCSMCNLKDKKPHCTEEFWNGEVKKGILGIKETQYVYDSLWTNEIDKKENEQ